jgi:hypothetical protein
MVSRFGLAFREASGQERRAVVSCQGCNAVVGRQVLLMALDFRFTDGRHGGRDDRKRYQPEEKREHEDHPCSPMMKGRAKRRVGNGHNRFPCYNI